MRLYVRCLLAALFLILAPLAIANASPTLSGKAVDKVLVLKSERKLQLLHRGDVLEQILPPRREIEIARREQPAVHQRKRVARTVCATAAVGRCIPRKLVLPWDHARARHLQRLQDILHDVAFVRLSRCRRDNFSEDRHAEV